MPDGRTNLEELMDALSAADRRATGVSDWSIGMHIHHCSLAMTGICRSLAASSPPPPRSRFIPAWWFVQLTGRIPRGRGKSPKDALPDGDLSRKDLEIVLGKSRRWVAKAEKLDRNTWYDHFAFGILHKDKALRLIRVHNHHHLRIIQDILAD